jgi:hypothetical protein
LYDEIRSHNNEASASNGEMSGTEMSARHWLTKEAEKTKVADDMAGGRRGGGDVDFIER